MQVKRERVEVEGRETITVSQPYGGESNDLSNHQVNVLVSGLLTKLAEELAKEDEYEFDGIGEPEFSEGQIAVTASLFVP